MMESIPIIPLGPTIEDKQIMFVQKKTLMRLDSLGYPSQEADKRFLDILTEKIKIEIQSEINRKKIPDCLCPAWADLIAVEFLQLMKGTGSLPTGDFTREIKQIQEGDTNITFDSGSTAEQRFDTMLGTLYQDAKRVIFKHRRIAW